MSKTKGFLYAAGMVLAMIFTFSCGEVGGGLDLVGDGSSSSGGNPSSSSGFYGNGACYFPFPGVDAAMCETSKNGQPITADFCSDVAFIAGNEYGDELQYQYIDSCPSGHKLRCEYDEYYFYYYGSSITPNITCDMLLGN